MFCLDCVFDFGMYLITSLVQCRLYRDIDLYHKTLFFLVETVSLETRYFTICTDSASSTASSY